MQAKPHSLERFLKEITQCLLAVVVMACIAGCLTLSPLELPAVDLLRNLPFFFVALAAVGLIVALLRQHRILLGLSVALLVIGLIPLWSYPWRVSNCCSEPQPNAHRVLLVNVHTKNQRMDELVNAVIAQRADTLVLQEVNQAWLAAFAPLAPHYPYRIESPSTDNFGIAVFSKYPLSDTQVGPLADGQPVSIQTTVETGPNLTLGLVATHPVPPITEFYRQLNRQQLESLTQIVHQSALPTLIVGDLNNSLWSRGFRELLAKTNLQDPRNRYGILPTWPAFSFPVGIPIDHIVHSADLHIVSLYSIAAPGSDHRMLIADVAK